jgi:hypothetical protein
MSRVGPATFPDRIRGLRRQRGVASIITAIFILFVALGCAALVT